MNHSVSQARRELLTGRWPGGAGVAQGTQAPGGDSGAAVPGGAV